MNNDDSVAMLGCAVSGRGLNAVVMDVGYPEPKTVVLQVLSLTVSVPVQVLVGNELAECGAQSQ